MDQNIIHQAMNEQELIQAYKNEKDAKTKERLFWQGRSSLIIRLPRMLQGISGMCVLGHQVAGQVRRTWDGRSS